MTNSEPSDPDPDPDPDLDPDPEAGASRPAVPFSHRLRVRYAETDAGKVAHHSSYVAWLEEARTEWMRSRGRSYRDVEDAGYFLVIADLHVHYASPSRYDDELSIAVWETARRRVDLELSYEIRLVEGGGLVATATTRLACIDAEGRVRRLPVGV